VSWRWLATAVVALVAGVILLLLAVDVGRWNTAFARDDVRFKLQPTQTDLWHAHTILPFEPAKRLLGISDDLFYRDTLRRFYLARPHANKWDTTMNIDALRSEATVALAAYIRDGKDPHRRSQAANLLGIIGLTLAATDDPGQRLRFLLFASRSFRGALTMDDTNEDAKFNLELTLRLLRQQPTSTGGGAAHGPGRGGGAALAKPGSGY
jgi:hypothetical protein